MGTFQGGPLASLGYCLFSLFQAFDFRADGAQFVLEFFVTPVKVIDAVDERITLGNETGEHE